MDFLTLLLAQAKPGGLLGLIDSMARTKLSYVVIFCVVCTVIRLLLAPTIAKTPPHLRIGTFKVAKFANELLDAVIYAGAFVFLVIRPFVLQTFYIPSGSMVPTLLVNDYIVANKAIYRYTEPQRGDIVVFRPPALALKMAEQEGDTDYVKRLIGVPGDLVEMKQNVVFINGEKINDPYKHFSKSDDNGQTFYAIDPNTLGSHDIVDYKLIEENGKAIPIIRGPKLDVMDSSATLKNGEFISDPIQQRELWAKPAVKIPAGFFTMMGDNRNNSSDGRFWGMVSRDNIIGRAEVIMMPFGRTSLLR